MKALGVAGLIGLMGCGPIVNFGDGTPETVYTLRTDDIPLQDPSGPYLFISLPSFAEGLGGRTVAVMIGDYERSALKNVRWATGAGDLIRDYLVASLRASTGARTLGEDGLDVKTSCRLNTYVWSMDYIPAEDGDSVHIRVETSLIDVVDGQMIARKTFNTTDSVKGRALDIMAGFNRSMEKVATELAAWMNAGDYLSQCEDITSDATND